MRECECECECECESESVREIKLTAALFAHHPRAACHHHADHAKHDLACALSVAQTEMANGTLPGEVLRRDLARSDHAPISFMLMPICVGPLSHSPRILNHSRSLLSLSLCP